MTRRVFDRRYTSPCAGTFEEPGTCPRCGRDLIANGTHPRYCDHRCRQAIVALPLEERARRRAVTPVGRCVNCAAAIPSARYGCSRARNAWIKHWRNASSGRLRFGQEAWEWLGAKLDLPASDERLPAIAKQLTKAGRLTLLVDGDRIVGIAKAKPSTSENDAGATPAARSE